MEDIATAQDDALICISSSVATRRAGQALSQSIVPPVCLEKGASRTLTSWSTATSVAGTAAHLRRSQCLAARLALYLRDPVPEMSTIGAHKNIPGLRQSLGIIQHPKSYPGSDMLRASDHISSHFAPIYACIQLFIHQSTHHDVVSSHQVQTVWLFCRRLVVALFADDTLDCVC
jgi:hypothetical protein